VHPLYAFIFVSFGEQHLFEGPDVVGEGGEAVGEGGGLVGEGAGSVGADTGESVGG